MPKKWIDKKQAVNFALVHRSHEDERYFDQDASEGVFVEIEKGQHHKPSALNPGSIPAPPSKTYNLRVEDKDQLEREVQEEQKSMRKNEGEAALYGITFDDSEYDYMQHLRTIGHDDGVFVPKELGKGGAKEASTKKEEIPGFKLKPEEEEFTVKELLGDEMLPSEKTIKYDYQKQQAVPDEISGFKPNLNEDLKQTLEALEDDAYLDDAQDVDDVDVFATLLPGKKQKDLSLAEYDRIEQEEEETAYAAASAAPVTKDEWDLDAYDEAANVGEDGNFDWENDFKQFKDAQNRGRVQNDWDSDDDFGSDDDDDDEAEERDGLGELPSFGDSKNSKKSKSKKSRRKKGAMTDTSGYSMSSSAMYRTEQMTIIDDRYDVMRERYEKDGDEDEESPEAFDFKNERSDFEGMIDDFLDNYQLERGRRFVKKDKEAERIMEAATDVSQGKLALKRKRAKAKKQAAASGGASSLKGLSGDMDKLHM